MFIDGNQEDLFKITRTADNSAIIRTLKRLDREAAASYLVTVKCFKKGTKPLPKTVYDDQDFSEIQILIKIIDIDDHLPEFLSKNPIIGIRSNVQIDQTITTLAAIDLDPDALPILYSIQNITFVPQFYKRENSTPENFDEIFTLNNATGEIRTGRNLADYVDGYFEVYIRANNSHLAKRSVDNKLKIFVIRDKSLLRFVFTKPASEVEATIDDFARKVQSKLMDDELELYILDTQVLMKEDSSLDFSSTR